MELEKYSFFKIILATLKKMHIEPELTLLSHLKDEISQNPNANQRDFANSTNLSLGMTNALLKKFADKGWVYMKKISARNIQYILTPAGINELAHRSSRYFKKTAHLLKNYKDCVASFIQTTVTPTYTKLVLIGQTDVEFLFDYACNKHHISFLKIDFFNDIVTNDSVFVFTEKEEYYKIVKQQEKKQFFYLLDILELSKIGQSK